MKSLILFLVLFLCGIEFASNEGSDLKQKQSSLIESRLDAINQVSSR